MISKKCAECAGKGVTYQDKKTNIPVPAGVEDGQTMRVTTSFIFQVMVTFKNSNMWNFQVNIGKQEIYITFKVKQSDIFRRDKEDVHSEVPISISQAILGGTIKIKGIYEDHQLKIPSGTQSHQRFRLTNKGIKRVHSSGYGDHYVYIKIKIPM